MSNVTTAPECMKRALAAMLATLPDDDARLLVLTQAVARNRLRLADPGKAHEYTVAWGNLLAAVEAMQEIAKTRPFAFAGIVLAGGFGIGRADDGIHGYTPCFEFGPLRTYEEAMDEAEALNELLGLDPERAFKIIMGTMRR